MSDRLEEIRARHLAAQRGPWRWRGNGKDVYLWCEHGMRSIVMSFFRRGTQGATPYFNDDGIMHPPRLLTPEPHNDWRVMGIDHPDARAIEYSWEDIDWLLGHIDAIRSECASIIKILTDDPRDMRPWMGMEKDQRQNITTLITLALEARTQRHREQREAQKGATE